MLQLANGTTPCFTVILESIFVTRMSCSEPVASVSIYLRCVAATSIASSLEQSTLLLLSPLHTFANPQETSNI